MRQYNPPVVPSELLPRLTDEVLAVHEELAAGRLEDFMDAATLLKRFPKLAPDETGAPIVLGDNPENGVDVLAESHQQAWKPSKAVKALVNHRVSNPDGLTIILPNNSISDRHYSFSEEEKAKISAGDLHPFFKRQVRTVESILDAYGSDIGPVALKGYSLGGLTAIGMAAVGSDKLDIRRVSAGEPPNKKQSVKELDKAFMQSSSPLDQRAAIKDAQLPMLSSALRPDRLALDYVRFGIANAINSGNKALKSGMAMGGLDALVERGLMQYDDVTMRIGHIAGSKLFAPELMAHISDERLKVDYYAEGEGSHRHATGDNPFALALMMDR